MPEEQFISAAIGVTILVATVIFASLWSWLFGRFIKRSAFILHNDPTSYKFLRHAITALIYVVGISLAIYRIDSLRTMATTLLAGAGILAVAVGFASQHALSNVISGIFIVIFKPFRVNDRISVRSELNGMVEDITLRHTVIRDYQNRRIVIPNAIISDEVILNSDMDDSRINRWLEFDISYDSDIDLAKQIIVDEVMNHPLKIDGRSEVQIEEGVPEVPVRVISLGDFSVKLRAWVWSNDQADSFAMHCDLLESVKKRFDREGVEIPFPYRTLVYKRDLEPNASLQTPDSSRSTQSTDSETDENSTQEF